MKDGCSENECMQIVVEGGKAYECLRRSALVGFPSPVYVGSQTPYFHLTT